MSDMTTTTTPEAPLQSQPPAAAAAGCVPRKDCKKRPVIVSLPPKKSTEGEHGGATTEGAGPEPHCHCNLCASEHHHQHHYHQPQPPHGEVHGPTQLFLHENPALAPHSLASCSSSESDSPTMDDEPVPSTSSSPTPDDMDRKQHHDPLAPLLSGSMHHGTYFKDPAVLYCSEPSRHQRGYHAVPNFLRMTGGDGSEGAASAECPCRYHQHHCGGGGIGGNAPSVDESVWDKLANKIDQLVEVRVQAMQQQQQTQPQQQQPMTATMHPRHHQQQQQQDEVRLEHLEISVEEMKQRLLAIESNQQPMARRHHSSMLAQQPPQQRLSTHSSSSNHGSSSSISHSSGSHHHHHHHHREQQDIAAWSHQLQRECQNLFTRLTEEQRKTEHLVQQQDDFHRRQTEELIKMQQQLNTLRAELRQSKGHQGKRGGAARRPVPPIMHQQPPAPAAVAMPTTNPASHYHPQLPTPSSSPTPPTGYPQHHHPQHHHHHHHHHQQRMSRQQPSPPSSPPPQDDGSVREEDGYLVFNTNINGELISYKVKIPNSTASSPTMHQRRLQYQQQHRHLYRQSMTDMPSTASAPTTRAGSPTAVRDHRMMVPPLPSKKRGLNPNAPEWKNGQWK